MKNAPYNKSHTERQGQRHYSSASDDIQRARSALFALPPDCDRDTWVKVGMAAKAAGLEFSDFDRWSEPGPTYNPTDARDVWKSFRADGGITGGTLFFLARDAGWQDTDSRSVYEAVKTPPRRINAPVEADTPRRSFAALWAVLEPAAANHEYIVRKGGSPEGLMSLPSECAPRIIKGQDVRGWIAVPMFSISDGDLTGIQFIPPQPGAEKLNEPGSSISGSAFRIGAAVEGKPVVIVEGLATGWSVHQATGLETFVAFGAGNMHSLAAKLIDGGRAPINVILAGDVDKAKKVRESAASLGCKWIVPSPDLGSTADFNDLAQMNGIDAVAAALGEAIQERRVQTTGRIEVKRLDGIRRNPQTKWLIGDWLPADITGAVIAPSHAGKSLLVMDWCAHVALGREWLGNVVEQGAVIYLSGEGGESGLGKRRQAWEVAHREQLDNSPFYYIDCMPNLLNPDDAVEVIEALKPIHSDTPIRLIVVDTKAVHMSGGDESSNDDGAAFCKNLIRIRQQFNATVLYVAHTGHSDKTRERGASSTYAAIDACFVLEKPDNQGSSIKCTKARDWMPPDPVGIVVKPVDLGYINEQTGENETAAVLEYTGAPAAKAKKMTPAEVLLRQIIAEVGEDEKAVRPIFIERNKWKEPTKDDSKRRNFERLWKATHLFVQTGQDRTNRVCPVSAPSLNFGRTGHTPLGVSVVRREVSGYQQRKDEEIEVLATFNFWRLSTGQLATGEVFN